MLDLPMLAFKMTGINECIELVINEVWGFPNETHYGGGYGAKGILTIRAGEYSVSGVHYFTTGELYRFSNELKRCCQALSGTAILENTERALELELEFNSFGQIFISGTFQANPSINNVLSFEIKTDQTQIRESITSLEAVYKVFGDNAGVGKLV